MILSLFTRLLDVDCKIHDAAVIRKCEFQNLTINKYKTHVCSFGSNFNEHSLCCIFIGWTHAAVYFDDSGSNKSNGILFIQHVNDYEWQFCWILLILSTFAAEFMSFCWISSTEQIEWASADIIIKWFIKRVLVPHFNWILRKFEFSCCSCDWSYKKKKRQANGRCFVYALELQKIAIARKGDNVQQAKMNFLVSHLFV